MNWKKRISEYPVLIQALVDPSEELQLIAVRGDPDVFQYIRHPAASVISYIIDKEPSQIVHINNPSDSLKLSIINKDYTNAQYIKNLSLALQNTVINLGGGKAIQYIRNPLPEIQARCFTMDRIGTLPYITDESLLVDIVGSWPECIKFIPNPSIKVQLEAVKTDPSVASYIKDPYQEVLDLIS